MSCRNEKILLSDSGTNNFSSGVSGWKLINYSCIAGHLGLFLIAMYEIYVETHFSAAHHLRDYCGKCEAPHGHNWIVEAYVQCEKLNEIGIGIDFKDVKDSVKIILEDLDHKDLNELAIFSKENPSSENIAKYLFKKLSQALNNDNIRVSKIKVCETPGNGSLYWE